MEVQLDPNAQQEISHILESGESLVWAGVPRQGLLLRPADAFMIPATWYAGVHWPGMGQYSTPGFELIPDAKRVHDKVLEAQRAVA